jgi:hypothetical protein
LGGPKVFKLTGPPQSKVVKSKSGTRGERSRLGPRYSAWNRTGFLIALKFNGACCTPFGMKTTVVEVMVCFSISSPIHRSISASKLLQRSGSSAPRKMRNSSYLWMWGVSQQTGVLNTCHPKESMLLPNLFLYCYGLYGSGKVFAGNYLIFHIYNFSR